MSYRAGPRWYSSLTPKDGKRKNALLGNNIPPGSFIVCHQLENRRFARFNSYFDYMKYVSTVPDEENCHYEVIIGPQKIYFDCDITRIPDNKDSNVTALKTIECPVQTTTSLIKAKRIIIKDDKMRLTLEEGDKAVKILMETIKKVFPKITDSQILVMTSHGAKKLSYHVVVDEWFFIDYLENLEFHKRVAELMPKEYVDILDHRVYKSIQQLRILGSHKWKDPRTKVLCDWCKWKYPVKPDNKDHAQILLMGASLITNISTCQVITGFHYKEVPRKIKFVGDDISENTAIEALKLLGNEADAYEIRDIEGGLICLQRNRATMCPICKREHDNENPYLTIVSNSKSSYALSASSSLEPISQIQQSVYYSCRRSSGHIFLGILGTKSSTISISDNKNIEEEDTHPFGLTPGISPSSSSFSSSQFSQSSFFSQSSSSLSSFFSQSSSSFSSSSSQSSSSLSSQSSSSLSSSQSSSSLSTSSSLLSFPNLQTKSISKIGFSGSIESASQLCNQLQRIAEVSYKPPCPRSKNKNYNIMVKRLQIHF